MTAAYGDPDVFHTARALLLDQAAATAILRLGDADIPSILLKGPVTAAWLYRGEVRSYRDIDLLVPPDEFERATDVLADLGYVDPLRGAHPGETNASERELVSPSRVCIDLHLGLIGLTAPPQLCWEQLAAHTTDFELAGGATVRALDVAARAMHLATHAAQNGPIDDKALADLHRGVAQLDNGTWKAAAEVARAVGATAAFAAGLRLLPDGRLLADRMALPDDMSVELALRTQSAPQDALFFERLSEVHGLRAKVRLVARKLFPTAAYMRANQPSDERGFLWLVRAWARHPFTLGRRFPAALAAWRRARRTSAHRDSSSR